MNYSITELRVSLNGVNENQISSLFRLFETEDKLVFKRIIDPRFSLSSDDFIIEGNFTKKFIDSITSIFPRILDFTIKMDSLGNFNLEKYSTKSWNYFDYKIFAGVTFLPNSHLKEFIKFKSYEQFLNVILSTEVGAILNPLLVVRSKGIIVVHKNFVKFILPAHRLNLISLWFQKLQNTEIDYDWLYGVSGEIPESMVSSMGFLDPNKIKKIPFWMKKIENLTLPNLETSFSRALKVIV